MKTRILLVAVVAFLLGGGEILAETVTFGKSQLDVVGSDGRHHPMTVEMAVTPEQLSQGLMFRNIILTIPAIVPSTKIGRASCRERVSSPV